jgi:hypothetical protein
MGIGSSSLFQPLDPLKIVVLFRQATALFLRFRRRTRKSMDFACAMSPYIPIVSRPQPFVLTCRDIRANSNLFTHPESLDKIYLDSEGFIVNVQEGVSLNMSHERLIFSSARLGCCRLLGNRLSVCHVYRITGT